MKGSQINIIKADDGLILPAAPNNAVLLGSAEKWQGIIIEHHLLPPQEMPEHFVQGHRLTVNVGKPLTFEWKTNKKWVDKYYPSGSFTMLSHGELHQPRWDKEFNFIAISYSPTFINNLIEVNNQSFSEQRAKEDKVLLTLSRTLIKELETECFMGSIYGESIAITMAIHLVEKYGRNQKILKPKGKLSAKQLNSVLEYFHSNLNNKVLLSELSKEIHLSPFHLARLFSQTIGIAPHQYFLKIKIERALGLIKKTNLSFTEIAYELGFMDQAHFSNQFKKYTGVSPSKLRKS